MMEELNEDVNQLVNQKGAKSFKIIFKVQGEVDSILGEKLLRRY